MLGTGKQKLIMTKLDILKALFDEFLIETQEKSVYRMDRKDKNKLNAHVFEFQAHVSSELKQLKLNLLLDPVIHSDSISDSFDKETKPFTPNDYCLAFFDFLNVQKNEKLDLFALIDKFIEQHKSELNWQDIVITASGATRCKTNLRFALKQLRGIGLIEKIDQEGKRIFFPTQQGELVFYSWRSTFNKGEPESFFRPIAECSFSTFYGVLNKLTLIKDDSGKREVAKFLEYKLRSDVAVVEVQNLLNDIDAFIKSAIITEKGIFIKLDKE